MFGLTPAERQIESLFISRCVNFMLRGLALCLNAIRWPGFGKPVYMIRQ